MKNKLLARIILWGSVSIGYFCFTNAKGQSYTGLNNKTSGTSSKLPFTIEGHLKNFKKKKAVIYVAWMEPWENHEFLKADVVDGKFKVSGHISQPAIGGLRIATFDDSLKPEQKFPWECDGVEFFLSSGKTIVVGTDSLTTAKIASPSKEYELYRSYTNSLSAASNEIDSIMSVWRSSRDSVKNKIFEYQYYLANEKRHRIYQSYIFQHPNSHVSITALNSYVNQINDEVRLKIATGLFGTLSKSLQTSPIAVAIKERIDDKLYPVVGKPMTSLVLESTDGSATDIMKYKGKVLLIDFWASWCSPCRKEFPDLIALYEKYKDRGVEFVGISIDESKSAWRKGITDNKLPWPQFVDTNPLENSYTGKAGRQFRISSVPAKFLVDSQGKIIAKNLTLDQFEAKIKSLLGEQKKN